MFNTHIPLETRLRHELLSQFQHIWISFLQLPTIYRYRFTNNGSHIPQLCSIPPTHSCGHRSLYLFVLLHSHSFNFSNTQSIIQSLNHSSLSISVCGEQTLIFSHFIFFHHHFFSSSSFFHFTNNYSPKIARRNSTNFRPCIGFVKKSPIISSVGQYSIRKFPFFT